MLGEVLKVEGWESSTLVKAYVHRTGGGIEIVIFRSFKYL